jgi:hypothetical protein
MPGIQVLRLDQSLLEIVWPVNRELTLLMLIKAHDAGRALVHTWSVGVPLSSLLFAGCGRGVWVSSSFPLRARQCRNATVLALMKSLMSTLLALKTLHFACGILCVLAPSLPVEWYCWQELNT